MCKPLDIDLCTCLAVIMPRKLRRIGPSGAGKGQHVPKTGKGAAKGGKESGKGNRHGHESCVNSGKPCCNFWCFLFVFVAFRSHNDDFSGGAGFAS